MRRNTKSTDSEIACSVVAAVVAAVATSLAIFPSTLGSDSSAHFGYVGRFRAVSTNMSYATVVPLQNCNKLCCCSLCTSDEQCAGANYRDDSHQCTLLRLSKWQLEPDVGYMLMLKGTALWSMEKRQYRTLSGVLDESVHIEGRGNYTVSMVQNGTQCQLFCEMLTSYCYAYQFHNVQLTCKVFVGNYTGNYLPISSTDRAWSFSYHFRLADGPYRILPGAYPNATSIASYVAINLMDSLRCRQQCESQSTTCSLFAYSADQLLCYIFSGDVSPNLLSFDFTSINWTAYYHFRNGSTAQELSTNYYFITKSLVRDEAEKYCISSFGALLVRIDSSDEYTFLTSVIKSTTALTNRNFWIGANSTTYPYNYRWSCGGDALTYSAWSVGEPNGVNDSCVYMKTNFTWNNSGCTFGLNFICEECRTAGH